MDEEYQIVYVDKPEESAWGIIGRGVSAYNKEQAGDSSKKTLFGCSLRIFVCVVEN